MANVLDIRRRIRSVKNTRQITKAMKMVSATKLRRAQERALAGRPYAQMLTNVLARREEKNILLLVVSGDKGLAGAFSANIMKAAGKFLAAKQGNNIDIEAVGRKGRDYFRRRYKSVSARGSASSRVAVIQITGEQVGILNRI